MAYIQLVIGFAVLWLCNYFVLESLLWALQKSDLYINASRTWDWPQSGRDTFVKGWWFRGAFVAFLANELVASGIAIVQGEGARWWMPFVLMGAVLMAMMGWYIGEPVRTSRMGGKGRSAALHVDDIRPFRYFLPRSYVPGAALGLLVATIFILVN